MNEKQLIRCLYTCRGDPADQATKNIRHLISSGLKLRSEAAREVWRRIRKHHTEHREAPDNSTLLAHFDQGWDKGVYDWLHLSTACDFRRSGDFQVALTRLQAEREKEELTERLKEVNAKLSENKVAEAKALFHAPEKTAQEATEATKRAELSARYVWIVPLSRVWDSQTGVLWKRENWNIQSQVHKAWLSPKYGPERPYATQVEWEPAKPTGLQKQGGTCNLFVPLPEPMPMEEGAFLPGLGRLLYHLAGVDSDHGLSYLLNMLIWRYQYMGRTAGSCAIVLVGPTGTGKGLLSRYLEALYGSYYGTVSNLELQSQFNAWIANRLCIFANEVNQVSFAQKRQVEKSLLSYVIGDRITVNQKNLPTYEINNHSTWWLSSNDRVPLMIRQDDRRYSVFRQTSKIPPKVRDLALAELKDPDLPLKLRAMTVEPVVSTWDPREPFDGIARREVQEGGASAPDLFWRSYMSTHQGAIPVPIILGDARDWYADQGHEKAPTVRALSMAMPHSIVRDRVRVSDPLIAAYRGRLSGNPGSRDKVSVWILPEIEGEQSEGRDIPDAAPVTPPTGRDHLALLEELD